MELPSGDQKGESAPSVPASGWVVKESSARNQSWRVFPVDALKTKRPPSGESARSGACDESVPVSLGSGIERRVTRDSADGLRRKSIVAINALPPAAG